MAVAKVDEVIHPPRDEIISRDQHGLAGIASVQFVAEACGRVRNSPVKWREVDCYTTKRRNSDEGTTDGREEHMSFQNLLLSFNYV